jgi:hypothetical protein
MPNIEDILAPGRALEAILRRAARGHRLAWRALIDHTPTLIDAETRWLFPALLNRRPGGARRAWLLPFAADHEQMLELLEHLARTPARRADPMFRGAQWLMLRHARDERAWLQRALAEHRALDDAPFARFVAHCRPLVEAAHALGTIAVPTSRDLGRIRLG